MNPKLLYVGMRYDYGRPGRGFDYGYRNIASSLKTFCNKRGWEMLFYDFMERGSELGLDAMTEELSDLSAREKPDYVFCSLFDFEHDPRHQAFAQMSARGAVTISWFSDDNWRFDNYSSQIAPCFDYVLTTIPGAVSRYQALGLGDKVIRTQWACNEELYRPSESVKDVDVSFVGMPHSDRVEVLNALIQNGLDVQVFGHGWTDRPRLPFYQMVRLFSRTKVNLNLSNSSSATSNQMKGRNFEIPGCGGFQLSGPAEGLADCYEDGKEIVVFHSTDDLIDKCRYYLEHDNEREAIARRGHERTIREHTWQHRLNDIFETIDRRTTAHRRAPVDVNSTGGDADSGHTITVGAWNYYESMNIGNAMFNAANNATNRDNVLSVFHRLREHGLENGVQIDSLDAMSDLSRAEAFLFFDFPDMNHPKVKQAMGTNALKFLVTFEPEVVRRENWTSQNQQLFDWIFTWNDDIVDGERIVKLGFCNELPSTIPKNIAAKTRMCAMINMAKSSEHDRELYSKRVEAIRWFEQNHPDDFDLYGIGWNQREYPSYRGPVPSKADVLKKTRFAICYENAEGFSGYITEKIFDCFVAGCVPIYWGAPNVAEYIPAHCYVDRLAFGTYAELYDFLTGITDDQYKAYLENIEQFLRSPQAEVFTSRHFARTIVERIKYNVTQSRRCAPAVSVAIPSYNYGRYVAQAIESVLGQDWDDLELVILDNASTDNTPEIVKPYLADSRVRHFRNDTTLPVQQNWQKAAGLCRGRYLAILSADDYFLPGHLSSLVRLLEDNPHCDLAYTRVQGVNEAGEAIYTNSSGDSIRPETYVGGYDEYTDSLVHGCYITPSAAIIRRDAFRKVGGFDTDCKGAIDLDLWIRLAERNPNFIFVGRPTTAYRFHGPQDSQRYFASAEPLEDYLRIVEKALSSPRAAQVRQAGEGIMKMIQMKLNNTPVIKRINAVAQALTDDVIPSEPSVGCDLKSPPIEACRPQTVSLCMIARNEEDFIEQALLSVDRLVCEKIVVDTGSDDATREIAAGCGAQVYDFVWNDSFADARNNAIGHAVGDWILFLDADETLDKAGIEAVLKAIHETEYAAYDFPIVNYLSGGNNPDIQLSQCCRLFRNIPKHRYSGRIHERVAPAVESAGGKTGLMSTVIHHHGYRPEVVQSRGKRERNVRLLNDELREKPDDAYTLYHLGNEHFSTGDYKKARRCYQKAVQNSRDCDVFTPLAYSHLTDTLIATGRNDDALRTVETAEGRRIVHPQLSHCKGNALRMLGRFGEAIDAYEQGLQMGQQGMWTGDPGTWGFKANYGAAAACVAEGRYERAISHAEMGLKSRPDCTELRDILAQARDLLHASPSDAAQSAVRLGSGQDTGSKPRLSLCMIVKNEEQFLEKCLQSVDGIVDELIVVDTGSVDRTVEIAGQHGAKVHLFEWTGSFADARNESLRYATGEWILILDADEVLDPMSHRAITDAIVNPIADGYELFFRNPVTLDSDADYTEHRVCRLFRNKPEYRFCSRIHENIETALLANGGKVASIEALIHHYGYTWDVVQARDKPERYTAMLEEELREHPGDLFYLHHLTAAYCAYGRYDKAVPRLREAVEIAPMDNSFTPLVWSNLVNGLVELRRPEEAMEVVEKAGALGIDHPQFAFCKGNVLAMLGRHEEAIESFRHAMETGRGRTWNGDTTTAGYKADFGIASCLKSLERYGEAIEHLRKVLDVKTDNEKALELLAQCAAGAGMIDEYANALEQLKDVAPGDVGPRIRLAELREHAGDTTGALERYMEIVDSGEATPAVWFKIATLLEAAGNPSDAEQAYLRCITNKPDCVQAYDNLGLLYAAQGDLQKAVDTFSQALTVDDTYANAYFNLGDLLYGAGDYATAAGFYQTGTKHDTARPNAVLMTGNCHFHLGNLQLAAAAYREALRLQPDNAEAANNLAMVEEMLESDRAA